MGAENGAPTMDRTPLIEDGWGGNQPGSAGAAHLIFGVECG